MKKGLNITKEELLGADYYIFTSLKDIQHGYKFYLLKDGKLKEVSGGPYWSESRNCYYCVSHYNDISEILRKICEALNTDYYLIEQKRVKKFFEVRKKM